MLETSVRLLRLLWLLHVRRDWSGADLASRLGVTTRTVRNDIERLRILGYEVHSSTGITGGYRLGAGSALPPLLLDDDDEAVAVGVGLAAAASGSVTGIEETSLRAMTKLEQTLPARLRHRADRVRPRLPTGPRFTPREPPEDAASHVVRGVGSLAWKHQARIRLHGSAEIMADRVPPEAGPLHPVDEHSCVLETGSDSLRDLVRYLTNLDVAFEVLDPPELRTLLRELADRYAAAAGDSPRATEPDRRTPS